MIRKILHFAILFILLSIFNQTYPQKSSSYQSNLEKAEELFSQLKKWQEEKNWEDFFSHKSTYLNQIESLLKSIEEPPILKIKADYLLLKVKSFLGLKGEREQQEIFLKNLQDIKTVDSELLSLLKDILRDIPEEKRKFRNDILYLYIKLLKKSNSPQIIKKELDFFYKQDDFNTFVELSRTYLGLIEKDANFESELKNFIKDSVCDGFRETCQPYFSEELFEKLSSREELSEDWLYLRAYNLEKASEYEKAVALYEYFLEKFPDSLLSEEVLLRLAFLYMYKLRNFSQAKTYFLKLEEKGFDREKHLNIIEERLDESKLSYNEKMFLRALKEDNPSLRGILSIETHPSKVFVNEKVDISSVFFSPDTGCLTPAGLYLWCGDLGQIKIATNTPSFSTSFKQAGFKIINLVELTAGDMILGFDSILLDIYEVRLEKIRTDQTKVKLKAEIYPYLPKSFLVFSWKIEKDNQLITQKEGEELILENTYPYSVKLSIYLLGRLIYNQEVYLNF